MVGADETLIFSIFKMLEIALSNSVQKTTYLFKRPTITLSNLLDRDKRNFKLSWQGDHLSFTYKILSSQLTTKKDLQILLKSSFCKNFYKKQPNL